MDRKSPLYQGSLVLVSVLTFLFVLFVLPEYPIFILPVFIVFMFLMGFSYVIRFRRMRAPQPQQEEVDRPSTTEQYIKQIDNMIREKK